MPQLHLEMPKLSNLVRQRDSRIYLFASSRTSDPVGIFHRSSNGVEVNAERVHVKRQEGSRIRPGVDEEYHFYIRPHTRYRSAKME